MKFIKWFYEAIGNNKSQRFWRLFILIVTIGVITMLIVNVGYDKTKGGIYWKPADISIKKGIEK
jgi:protein tyrosine phosphatase